MSVTPISDTPADVDAEEAQLIADVDAFLAGDSEPGSPETVTEPEGGEAATTPPGDTLPPAAETPEVAEIAPDDLTPDPDDGVLSTPPVAGEGEAYTPPPPVPPDDSVDLNVIFKTAMGAPATTEEAVQGIQFLADVRRMVQNDPRRAQIVEAIMYAPDVDAVLAQAAPKSTAPAAPPPAAAEPWATPDEDTPVDPGIAQLQQRLDAMEAERQQAQAQQEVQWQQHVQTQTGHGLADFVEQQRANGIAIDNNDVAIIQAHVNATRTFESTFSATPQDPRGAYRIAMETAMYQLPAYRQKIVEQQAQIQAKQVLEEERRKAAAGAVTTRPSASSAGPQGPLDAAQSNAAAVAEAAMWLNSGEPT